jgi:flagellar biosynthesis/type III secretory pathway protein FliH
MRTPEDAVAELCELAGRHDTEMPSETVLTFVRQLTKEAAAESQDAYEEGYATGRMEGRTEGFYENCYH